MYLVYLFKEKKTGEIIYVGSSSRPSARLKEHGAQLRGDKQPCKIHNYMNAKKLKLYKDVEVIWVDSANDKNEMLELETEMIPRAVSSSSMSIFSARALTAA